MDAGVISPVLIAAVGGWLTWLVRGIRNDVQEAKAEINEKVQRSHDRLESQVGRLNDRMDRIADDLYGRVSKVESAFARLDERTRET